MRDLLDTTQPLWLPKGSVRGILALAVVLAFIAGYVTELEIVTLVLGFYFGQKTVS